MCAHMLTVHTNTRACVWAHKYTHAPHTHTSTTHARMHEKRERERRVGGGGGGRERYHWKGDKSYEHDQQKAFRLLPVC